MVVASFLSVAFLPLFPLIAVAIRIESPGPAFFRQPRRGRGGRHFTLLKFRSMRADAAAKRSEHSEINEVDEPLFKIRTDPRTTSVGRVLRRFSLDEIPQLVNVLRGEMSLVGPRPLPIDDVEPFWDHQKSSQWLKDRETVRPGITGLWQVGGRSELPYDEMRQQDRYYIENWSLLLDFQILLRTIPAVLLRKGAY